MVTAFRPESMHFRASLFPLRTIPASTSGRIADKFLRFPAREGVFSRLPSAKRLLCPPPSASSGGRAGNGNAAVRVSIPVEGDQAPQSLSIVQWLSAFLKFTRPHTMVGTFISVCSVSLLALQRPEDFTARAALALAQSLSSALLMNVAIVGLNQLYDVEIDKINKPYLPLASGEFSMATGWTIVGAACVAGLALGAASGSLPLMATLAGSWTLGFLYSAELPFLRWKRNPALAAACILAVRAVMVQLGFYYHMRLSVISGPPELSLPLLFTVGFMFVFSIVIALFKDIPDVRGDEKSGVRTLSVRMGAKNVLRICLGLLSTAYVSAAAFGLAFLPPGVPQTCIVVGHVAMLAALWIRARGCDASSSKAVYALYMDVWLLFYCEYLLIPLYRA